MDDYAETDLPVGDRIFQVDDNFVISSDQVWRPGAYGTREAAELALLCPDDETLQAMQDRANARAGGSGGVILLEDFG